jgi:hypothetical protein
MNRWQVYVAVTALAVFLGLLVPGFFPPEYSHGPAPEVRRRAARGHLYEQAALSLVPLVVGAVAVYLLRSRRR